MTKQKFKEKLKSLNVEELEDECEKFIWLSAYASNNSKSDYHWMCDFCYDECKERNNIDIYKNAYNRVSKNG